VINSSRGGLLVAFSVGLYPLGTLSARTTSRSVISDLGALAPRTSTTALGINNRGEVVGFIGDERLRTRPFVIRAGKLVVLPILGGRLNTAIGINDQGQIADSSSLAGSKESHAVLWSNGKLIDLGVRGVTSYASAINNRGQIVGWTQTSHGTRPVMWRGGKMTDLRMLHGADGGMANGINDRGQIVGTNYVGPGWLHAVLWDKGKITDIGSLARADGNSVALKINDRGQVVGRGNLRGIAPGLAEVALVWQNRKPIRLVGLAQPSALPDQASAINNRGQIVGYANAPPGKPEDQAAVLWEQGKAHDLGGRVGRYHIAEAAAINERGQIVGNRKTREGTHVDAVMWARRES